MPGTFVYWLTCSGAGGQGSQSAIVTVLEPPPPPPPPPPPGPPACTVADTSGCVGGSEVVVTNRGWTCSQPLTSYGTLPLRVTVAATAPFAGTGVTLTSGCAGDGDPATIDLILEIQGDGRTYGPSEDAIKTKLQAGYNAGIQVTGRADCGPPGDASHQDGVQAQGGRDITFVDFRIGNYDGGISTCHGAGGAFFYSGANGYTAQATHVVRGRYIACTKGLGAGSSTGSVTDASFRSGRTDGTDPACVGYSSPSTCTATSGVVWTNVVCEKWNRTALNWQRNN